MKVRSRDRHSVGARRRRPWLPMLPRTRSTRLGALGVAIVVLVAVLGLGPSGLGGGAARAQETAHEAERAQDRVLRLEHGNATGSALVLGRKGSSLLAVTAYHVTETSDPIRARARLWPDLPLEVRVSKEHADAALDLAVIRVILPPQVLASIPEGWSSIPFAPLSRSEARGPYRLVGHPSYQRWLVSPEVELEGVRKSWATFHHHCDDGFSGGGVFDASWRLVALVSQRKAPMLCEGLAAEAIHRIVTIRWELATDWEPQVRTAGRRSAGRGDRQVGLVDLVAAPGLRLPPQTDLDGALLAVLLEGLEGVEAVSGPRKGAWRLSAEVLDYAQSREAGGGYGISLHSDVFRARLRLRLEDGMGKELFSKVFPVEVVDHGGVDGLADYSGAPMKELLSQLAEEARRELRAIISN